MQYKVDKTPVLLDKRNLEHVMQNSILIFQNIAHIAFLKKKCMDAISHMMLPLFKLVARDIIVYPSYTSLVSAGSTGSPTGGSGGGEGEHAKLIA